MLPVRASKAESVDYTNAAKSDSVNVKVVVRLRPPNDKELSSGKVNLIKPVDDHMLTFDPKDDEWNNLVTHKSRPGTDKKTKDLLFAFDRVFDGNSTNDEVFENTTKSAIDSVLKGFNCSVFAYGATSAGKTHTMLGSPEEPGVIFLTMMELYRCLMLKKEQYESDISVSYLEIYNETCKDLLLPKGPLAVREDPEKGVCVSGLSLHKPASAEELLEMLHYGNQNRSQHPTDANKQSSRSHAVFQVFVRQSEKATGLNTNVLFAKMSLIDLAGSERATVTTNQGDRLREGANINKSLLALGNCINALAENKSKAHIPYRDSKLTRLLKDSLGGNCETIMIAAVSPSVLSYEDTYNTLKYADRAKNIKASLTANTVSMDYHVSQYGKIVEDLKSQIATLKIQIEQQENENKENENTESNFNIDGEFYKVLQGYEKNVNSLYRERCSLQQNLVISESSGKELSIKLLLKERNYKRLEHISEIAGSVPQKAHEKLDKYKTSYETKQAHYLKQKVLITSSMEENMTKLNELQNEMNEWANKTDPFILSHMNMLYDLKQLELKYVSVKAQCKYLRKQLPLQEAENRNNEQLIAQLLQIIASQQRKLNIQMSNATPSKMNISLDAVKDLPNQLVEGTKIAWADQTMTIDASNNFNETYSQLDVSPYMTQNKTPSKKPYVLRKIISENRRNSEETHRNTILNAKPTHYLSTPSLASSCMDMAKENCGTVELKNRCISVSSNISDSHTDLNGTYVTEPSESIFHRPLEDHFPDGRPKTSGIPVRTPVKNIENEHKQRAKHRRSMSDGHDVLSLAKSKAKSFGKLLTPRNISRAATKSTSSLVPKKVLKFAPTRASNIKLAHKENIEPIKSRFAGRTMKRYKSESTLQSYKRSTTSEQQQRTFRF